MTPRSTFALALCAYIAATAASLYTRRGGAEERSTPSGRAAASYIQCEATAAARIDAQGDRLPSWSAPVPVAQVPVKYRKMEAGSRACLGQPPSRYPRTLRWLPLVERVLNEQSGE